MVEERKINYKWLIAAFGVLTFVFLLSEYTIYKLDEMLEGYDSEEPVVEINVYLSENLTMELPEEVQATNEAEKGVNSSIIKALLDPLMRGKRQSAMLPVIPGYVCTAELFMNVDPCCPTPVFLKESELQSCIRRRFARSMPVEENSKSNATNSSESETDYNYFDYHVEDSNATKGRPAPQSAQSVYYRWLPIRVYQFTPRKNNARSQQRQSQPATIGRKTPTRQICMVDCMFRTLKWISPENVLNMDLMFTAMTAMVPTSWASLLSTAKTDCANVTAGGGMIENVLDANRKVCLVAPIKLMRCIKRSLIMACPSMLDSGPQCTMNTNVLRQCDVLAL
ncbi:uncharacterized protein LOC135940720 isoform X1 [Cloeon dipterum]|uniref:uncharacterized protein LOC135940720 isoform X1 n=1 Tax=Cloeon dipterum TaxID=197152 RepID=UPI0032206982